MLNKIISNFLKDYTLLNNNIFSLLPYFNEKELKVYLASLKVVNENNLDDFPYINKISAICNLNENEVLEALDKLSQKSLLAFSDKKIRIFIPDSSIEYSKVNQKYKNLQNILINITNTYFKDKEILEIMETANCCGIREDGIKQIINYIKGLGWEKEKSAKYIIATIKDFYSRMLISDDDIDSYIKKKKVLQEGLYELKKLFGIKGENSEQEYKYYQSWLQHKFTKSLLIKILSSDYFFTKSFKTLNSQINKIYDEVYLFCETYSKEITTQEIDNYLEKYYFAADEIKHEIISTLNIKVENSGKAYTKTIINYLKHGYSKTSLLTILKRVEIYNFQNFSVFKNKVDFFIENGIIDENQIKNIIGEEIKYNKKLVKIFYKLNSMKKVATDQEIELYKKWKNIYKLKDDDIYNTIEALKINFPNLLKLDEYLQKVKDIENKSVENIQKLFNQYNLNNDITNDFRYKEKGLSKFKKD